MIEQIEEKDWTQYGHNKFLCRSLTPNDPNYRSSEDFDSNTEDAALRSSKIGGRILVKSLIVNDGVNNRVVVGYEQNGF